MVAMCMAIGCSRVDNSLRPPPNVTRDAELDDDLEPPSLSLQLNVPALFSQATGPYVVLIIEAETEKIVQRIDLPYVDEWPHQLPLNNQLRGRHLALAFLDQNADRNFDDCPFPAEPHATQQPERFDHVQGRLNLSLPIRSNKELTIERRICGPGRSDTSVHGRLVGLESPSDVPIRLLAVNEETGQSLRSELWPYRNSEDEDWQFIIRELLPGTYTFTIFTDHDNDYSPTPCAALYGGADRQAVTISSVSVLEGEQTELAQAITFEPSTCESTLTGVSGRLSLQNTPTVTEREFSSFSRDQGSTWISLIPLENELEVINIPIATNLIDRPQPINYTITGVPPGSWRVVAYIDRDEDRFFSPCNTVSGGLDLYTGYLESVRVQQGEITTADELLLKELDCDDAELSGIRGEVAVVQEQGAISSGRRLYLDIRNTNASNAAPSLAIFERHTDHTLGSSPFLKQLEPGRYTGQFFVDTDSDSVMNACTNETYGDRYISQEIAFEVTPLQITDLGSFVISPTSGCFEALQTINATLNVDNVDRLSVSELLVEVSEAGGWTEVKAVDIDTATEAFSLGGYPPGDYRLTVFSDANQTGRFEPCDGLSGDVIYGAILMEIESERAPPAVVFELSENCPL